MPAPFFNPAPTSDDHLFIRDIYRETMRSEPGLVGHVEQEILDAFTVSRSSSPGECWPPPQAYVAADGTAITLLGFNPDPALCAPLLVRAIRRTIARVVAHRITRSQLPSLVKESQTDTRRTTYSADAERELPAGWDKDLEPFRLQRGTLLLWAI